MSEMNGSALHTMATTSSAVTTVVPALHDEPPTERVAVITLRPTQTQSKKKVVWTEDTVDNEDMNKKKSKCCCIYEKPRKFDESDSEDSDDECEHCFGHVEHRRMHHAQQHSDGGATTVQIAPEESAVAQPEPAAMIVLHQPTEPDASSDPPDVGKDVVDSK